MKQKKYSRVGLIIELEKIFKSKKIIFTGGCYNLYLDLPFNNKLNIVITKNLTILASVIFNENKRDLILFKVDIDNKFSIESFANNINDKLQRHSLRFDSYIEFKDKNDFLFDDEEFNFN